MPYMNPDGSYHSEVGGQPVTTFTPLTGTTVTIPSGAREVFINPAGTIAALTIKLPRAPENNMSLDVGFGAAVTALTWQDGAGNAVSGLASAGAAGAATQVAYVPRAAVPGAPNYGWVKWR